MGLTKTLIIAGVASCAVACSPPAERAAGYLAAAQERFDEGDYVKAKLEARNAVQIEPKNAQARYLLAVIAEEEGQPQQMFEHLLMAVDADPTMVNARVKLGTLMSLARLHEEAAEQAAEAMKLAPDDPEVRVLQARVLVQQGDQDGALAQVAETLARNPDHVTAIGLKASILADDDPDQALSVLEAAIDRLPVTDTEALRRLKLLILAGQQRPEEVERELLAMTKAMPEKLTYQVRLARLYSAQGRAQEAEEILRDLVASGRADEEIDPKLELVLFLGQMRTPQAVEEALKSFVEKEPDNQRLKNALAQFYEENGRSDEAVAIYTKAIAMDAKSEYGLFARNRLAAQRIQEGDRKGAETLIQGILADAPDNAGALLLQAGMLFSEDRLDDAVAALRIVLRKEPDNARALLMLARTHARMGDTSLAKDAYRRLLELNPGNADAAREFVGLAAQSGNLTEAEEALRRIVETNPRNVEVGTVLADVLAMQGDWKAAETEARRLTALEDQKGIAQYQLGRVLEEQRRYADAAKAFRQALEKTPDDLLMLQGLARALNAQGMQAQAIAELRELVKTRPDAVNARLVLGDALGNEGKTREAQQLLESVIADQPGLPGGYLVLADLYPDDRDSRIAAYRRGLAAVPGDPQLSAGLGQEYMETGRVNELISLLEDVLAVNPRLEWATNDLAATLLDYRSQDPPSMERALRLAESLAASDNPAVMDTVGWAYYRAGKNAEAIRYLERAAAAAGSDIPAVNYHLGMAYLASGNPVNARQALDKALASPDAEFPGIDEARRALAQLAGAD